ncbi:MAG: hypothetical protein ABW026_10025 [Microvirga sp.]
MSPRRKDPAAGNPHTGDGKAAKGKKPTEVGIRQMRDRDGELSRKQPRGWGIARVIDIVTGKERKK